MKKLILMWLFGNDNIEKYIDLLRSNIQYVNTSLEGHEACLKEIESHRESLEREQEMLKTMYKLIKICKNNGINIDEEIKKVEIND